MATIEDSIRTLEFLKWLIIFKIFFHPLLLFLFILRLLKFLNFSHSLHTLECRENYYLPLQWLWNIQEVFSFLKIYPPMLISDPAVIIF